jgi:hypothetical protein
MTPPGLAFVAISDKAWKAIDEATLPRFYFCFKQSGFFERGSRDKHLRGRGCNAWVRKGGKTND